MVDQAISLLSGHHQEVIQSLKKQMNDASEKLEFEKAAVFRDRIKAVEFLSQSQKIEHAAADEDRDIIGIAKDEDNALIQVFFIRGGKLIGREHFLLENAGLLPEGQLIGVFIQQFYGGTAFIPKELLVTALPDEVSLLQEFLSSKRGSSVQILRPQRGEKVRLIELASKNAELTLGQFGQRMKSEEKRTKGAVRQLEELLGFTEFPFTRIEAYDISNTFGSLSVGSMVVFEDGKPKSSDYRKFRIETVEGANDYASMQEVLTRRFTHAVREMKELAEEGRDPSLGSFTKLPDLLLMQLSDRANPLCCHNND